MDNTVAPSVGCRIRAIREERGHSLRALAELSGLSLNAISRIERGENSPTVSSLHQLARALKVSIVDLFEIEAECSTIYLTPDHRLRSQANGVSMESLGSGLRGQQLEPFLITIEPSARKLDELVTHAGEECVYCLRGRIDYVINGVVYTLTAESSLLFDASQPHAFHNPTADEAKMILIFQSRGDIDAARQRHLEVQSVKA